MRVIPQVSSRHVLFFFFFSRRVWRCRFFQVFSVQFPLSLRMESTSYVLSFPMAFFYLLTTGWIFYISLFENPINQPTSHTVHERQFRCCSVVRLCLVPKSSSGNKYYVYTLPTSPRIDRPPHLDHHAPAL